MDNSVLNDNKHFVRKLEGMIEIAALALLYYIFWKYFYRPVGRFPYYGMGKYVLVGVYAFLTYVLFYNLECLRFGYLRGVDATVGQWISIVIVNTITYFQLCLMANRMMKIYPILLLTITDSIAAVLFVYVYTWLYHHLNAPKNMLMIYGNKKAITLKVKMDQRADKYHITKVMSCETAPELIREQILSHDAVIINDVHAEIRNDFLKFCYKNKVRTYVVPKLSDIINRGGEEINLFDTPLFLISGTGPTQMQLLVKRVFDILLCLIALILGAPVMLIVAIAIKLEDGGPVFYKQERVTKDEKRFSILKFRSMIVDAEGDGKSIPARDHDPRITKVGHLIRATRIDELPQIINILKGDMSIVGPRPERVEHHISYTEEIPEFVFRTKVKGGLTGYAQIYGKYNTSAYDKLKLDLMYIENYSFMLDMKLILMTLQTMVRPESTEGFDKVVTVEDVIKQLGDDK